MTFQYFGDTQTLSLPEVVVFCRIALKCGTQVKQPMWHLFLFKFLIWYCSPFLGQSFSFASITDMGTWKAGKLYMDVLSTFLQMYQVWGFCFYHDDLYENRKPFEMKQKKKVFSFTNLKLGCWFGIFPNSQRKINQIFEMYMKVVMLSECIRLQL